MFNPFKSDIKKVLGPYVADKKTLRKLVVIVFTDGSKTTMSNARWLMTQHLKRRLEDREHVDHIDGDPSNDHIENFQLLTPEENSRKSSLGKESPLRGVEKGWSHGTQYGWLKKKCQCDKCLDHKKSWQEARNKKRRKSSSRGPYTKNPPHGSTKKYHRGCKCDLCRKANAEREAARRKLKKTQCLMA
jgi:hypothetical protein